MSIYSTEALLRINALRQKSLQSPEGLSLEETQEVIKIMREDRKAAAQPTKGSRAKAPVKSGDDLLSELDGL